MAQFALCESWVRKISVKVISHGDSTPRTGENPELQNKQLGKKDSERMRINRSLVFPKMTPRDLKQAKRDYLIGGLRTTV